MAVQADVYDAAAGREVGVRALKAKLSEHLAHVKSGGVVTVTERGRPIARLVPVEGVEIPPELAALIESGEVQWSGRQLPPLRPMPLLLAAQPGGRKSDAKTMSQIVSEGREDRV
jgi:prevent-host-death family protein